MLLSATVAPSDQTTTPRPSRRKRRELARRADRLIASLRGTLLTMPYHASPRDCVLLLAEGVSPLVALRARIRSGLQALGLELAGLDEILAEIAASPLDDGLRYPALILIEGWVQVAFVECPPLVRGGEA